MNANMFKILKKKLDVIQLTYLKNNMVENWKMGTQGFGNNIELSTYIHCHLYWTS